MQISVWYVANVEPGRSPTWVSRAPGIAVGRIHTVMPTGWSSEAILLLTFEGSIGGIVGKLKRSINEHCIARESAAPNKRSEHPPATARLR